MNVSNYSINNSNGSEGFKNDEIKEWQLTFITIIYLLIFLIGFIGNFLIIIIVKYNKTLRHGTNYCLVNLCIADLLLIIVCMPSAIVDLYAKEVWYFGYLMCMFSFKSNKIYFKFINNMF
jgi:hypothetical protein